MPFKKGQPKIGGRKPGSANKATLEIKARIDKVLEGDAGWEKLREQFNNGELSVPVLLRLIEYRIGKPKESLEVSGPDGGPMEHVAKLSSDLLRRMRQELGETE